MKFSLKNYYHPTPKFFRKLGDAILYSCGSVGAGGLIAFEELKEIFAEQELKIVIGSVLVLGFVGKFLSNFFKDETP